MHVRGEPQPDKLGLCDRRHATKFICLSCSSLTIDADGNKVESRYHPYGQERWSSGTLATEYRFTGQKYEAGVGGLHQIGARWYSLFKETNGVYTVSFDTPSARLHTHAHWVKSTSDPEGAISNLASAGLDLLGNVCFLNVELAPASTFLGLGALWVGTLADLGAAEESFTRIAAYSKGWTGRFDSSDVLNVVGAIPEVGILPDIISALSELSGVKLEFTP
jgi:hypothetical protein